VTRFLVDTSALARMPLEPVRRRLAPIIEAGEAATCSIVDLEVLYSVRNFEVPIPDLLVAAAAETGRLTLLPYDGDYDIIAGVTGQPAEWIVPRGSV
jgi:predicted nucleic acid-binding protein